MHALKGIGGSRKREIEASSTRIDGRHSLWLVAVDSLKSRLAAWIDRGDGVRFADRLDVAYFEQLTAERKVIKRFQGQPRRVWERIPGRRAEALDCFVYAYAVRMRFSTFDFARQAEAFKAAGVGRALPPRPAAPVQRRRVVRSSYMQN